MKNKITKTDIKKLLKDKLANNAGFAKWALLEMYNHQTPAEKLIHQNTEANGEGFSGTDCKFLTSLAQWLKTNGWLSPKQMERLHKQMPKYWNQVAEILTEEQLDDVINGRFVPPPKTNQTIINTTIDLLKVRNEVKAILAEAYPGVQIIENFRPPELGGLSFDFHVPSDGFSVDITGTKERPVTTSAHCSETARKGCWANRNRFPFCFVRADQPNPSEKLRRYLKSELYQKHISRPVANLGSNRFSKSAKPVYDGTLWEVDENGNYGDAVTPGTSPATTAMAVMAETSNEPQTIF